MAGVPDRRHFIVMLLDNAQAWKCQQISDKRLGSCEHSSHNEGKKELAGDFLGRPAKPELYLCHRQSLHRKQTRALAMAQKLMAFFKR